MSSKTPKDLLWIVPRLPWPPRCGASYANCELIRAMADRGHRIQLICWSNDSVEVVHPEAQHQLGVDSISVLQWPALLRNKWTRLLICLGLQCLRRKMPLSVIPFTARRFRRKLNQFLSRHRFTTTIWDGLHPMVIALDQNPNDSKRINIYRAHNIEASIWRGFGRALPWPFGHLFQWQISKMESFERTCMRYSSGIAFVQSDDEAWFKSNVSQSAQTQLVPISVDIPGDTAAWQAARWKNAQRKRGDEKGISLLWIGGLDWWPNKQAIEWFLKNIWKNVTRIRPDARLTLVGKGTERLDTAQINNIKVFGFAQDLSLVLNKADLLVVPIQSGGGMRVKALDALSRGVPCIGTPLGISGLPKEGLYICDDEHEWIRVISNVTPEECFIRGMMGFRAVQSQFDRAESAQRLDELIEKCEQASATPKMHHSTA